MILLRSYSQLNNKLILSVQNHYSFSLGAFLYSNLVYSMG